MAIFNGTSGNDFLIGGTGNDVLTGGLGNDFLNGGDGDDQLFGNDGNDTLLGGAGFDNLTGGAGDDLLDGGADFDSVQYFDATGPVTVNLALGTASGAGIGTDTLISIENVRGSSYNDTLIGSTGNDNLNGQDGNDSISGGAGSDNLYGGKGNDTLTGGVGSDFFGLRNSSDDTSVDTITDFTAGNVADSDRLSIPTFILTNYTSGSNPFGSGHSRLTQSGTDTLLELDIDGSTGPGAFQTVAILKNVVKSTLTANNLSGLNPNVISGTSGPDSLVGTAGDDELYGLAGNDTLNGLAGNDRLNGGLGNDFLDGGDGYDQLYGNDGNDTLLGGAGIDFLSGGEGDDLLAGGAGFDSVRYFAATGPVTVNLSLGTASGAGIGTDTLVSIEHVSGSCQVPPVYKHV